MIQNHYHYKENNQKLIHNSYFHYTTWEFLTVDLSVEEMRDTFQYVRERNYELFKMFYEWDEVKYRGGKIVNEWD